eukprot:TRINITY_DN28152_c0_g1_i1.p1 TRINITY_DN28152_c0_g1~~TRINITY_DN28152_c0_g1_i1.p1  ORF type:complete len:365 (-),score=38.05 TRINITY_DN28152_c0_g1_i1:10-954(-)
MQILKTIPGNCKFQEQDVHVSMNLKLDACVVAQGSGESGFRVDEAHIVVLDNFVGNETRQNVLNHITENGWDHTQGPPQSKWEKRTADTAGAPATWGLKSEVLSQLSSCDCEAFQEIQTRLSVLYPEVDIYHMPAELLHQSKLEVESTEEQFFCDEFVGNAAVQGDEYNWHIDADPSNFSDCPWVQQYGRYSNREAGKPIFVSMLLYLNETWDRSWDAETLFLDTSTDTGVFVRPKGGRIVLMDQDIVHRLSSPSTKAQLPRYSLVWKLVFVPRDKNKEFSISRPEWGKPTAFGSSNKLLPPNAASAQSPYVLM